MNKKTVKMDTNTGMSNPKMTKVSKAITHSLLCSALALPLLMPNGTVFANGYTAISSVQNVNIAAGDLATNLNRFAANNKVVIFFDASLTKGLKSKALTGKYTIDSALDQLLNGSGLKYVKEADGSYRVISASTDVMTLATAQVTDNALGSNTEGTGAYTTGSMTSATGLSMSVRETPQSVSIVSAQLIEDEDIRSLNDAVSSAAGISTRELDSTRFRYSARGFTVENYQIDGIPMPLSNSGEGATSTAIYERVEIVRGATGLLNGVGNPSAAINLIRKRAHSAEFKGSATASVGSWSDYRALLDLSSGLNDDGNVRGRLVFEYEDSGSYVDFASNKKMVAYGIIDTDITEDTLLSTGFSYQDNQPKGSTWGGLPLWYSDGDRTDWETSKTTAPTWSYWDSTNINYFANLTHNISDDWQIKLNFNQANNDIDRELLYMSGTVDKTTGLGLRGSPSKGKIDTEQTDLGLHVNGNFSLFEQQHEVVFGITHSTYDYLDYNYARETRPTPGDFNNWDGSYAKPQWGEASLRHELTETQKGFYGATRLAITNDFTMVLGARFADWQEKGISRDKPVNYSDDSIIPYAGVLYDIQDNHTIYGSYTEIFQVQNKNDKFGTQLDPLTGINYELGFKSEFFDGAVNTSFALFKIDQDNLAERDGDNTVPGTGIDGEDPEQAYIGLQGTTSEGFEMEVVGEITTGLHVSMSYTQFSAESAEGEDVLTYQPRKLFKLNTRYDFSGDLDKLSIAAGIDWQDNNYTDKKNPVSKEEEVLEQEAYALVDLMARYQFSQQLSAQINIDNLLDKKYYSQIGFYSQYAYGQPRSVNLSVKYLF
jgi:outer membrane receptor for ferric coprogen and ferric-rhodotorulic acid